MHNLVEQYRLRGFIPAVKFDNIGEVEHPNQIRVAHSAMKTIPDPACEVSDSQDQAIQFLRQGFDQLVTVPDSKSYIPPLAPYSMMSELGDPLSTLGNMVRASAQGLIADIWTQLLEQKVDQDERTASRPCHLLWDRQVPLVNPLTSLFWLLTCETWPLPLNLDGWTVDYEDARCFPPTAHVIPASTSRPVASRQMDSIQYGGRPKVVPQGSMWQTLQQVMNGHLTRLDRDRMTKYSVMTVTQPFYRPQSGEHSILRLKPRSVNADNGKAWTYNEGFHGGIFRQVGGYAYTQTVDSHLNIYAVSELRRRVFQSGGVVTYPGIPTGEHNIYEIPGGWIRNWSEYGLILRDVPDDQRLTWTSEDHKMKIAGKPFMYVPNATPPFWLGWTHIGPNFGVSLDGDPTREVTPSQEWVDSYQKHRNLAIRMLFSPGTVNVLDMIQDNRMERTERLEKAGRLKAAAGSNDSAKATMAAIINESAAKFKLFG